jgi:chaperonin GroES
VNTLQPLADRILVRTIDEPNVTAGGVVIPDLAAEPPQRGRVVAVGPGVYFPRLGHRVPLDVEVGDEVAYMRHAGVEVRHDGEDLLILRWDSVVAVRQEAPDA